MEYNFHGVTREWVKQAFTTLVDHLKDYQSDLVQWQAAATKQMVDNADRCTALEESDSAQDKKITNLTDQISAQDKKITNLTNTVSTLTDTVSAQDTKITNLDKKITDLTDTVNNLIEAMTNEEAVRIVDDNWSS